MPPLVHILDEGGCSMFRIGICVLISFLISVSVVPLASASDSVESMANLSEEFYTLTKEAKWLEARNTLWKLTSTFSQHNWEDMNISVEGIHALSDALIQAKQALSRAELDPHEVRMHGIRVRLGVDALQNREQLLWHRYYNVLKEDIAQLKRTVPTGAKADVQQATDRLYAHYMLIQPALYVARSPEVVEQVNALFTYMHNQIHDVTINRQQLQDAVGQWEQILNPLFYGTDNEVLAVAHLPEFPIFLATWLLAVLIGAVLTYVVWRKAQAEQIIRL